MTLRNTGDGRRSLLALLAFLPALFLLACAPRAVLPPEKIPKTVLVLPPENTTAAGAEVTKIVYPAVYHHLATQGYYTVSPELAVTVFQKNKLEDPGRIQKIAPAKFREIFGADAILKVRVTDWSSKYFVISSRVTVAYEMELVDCRTGEVLWKKEKSLSEAPGGSNGGIAGALIGAAMHAAMTSYEPIADKNAKEMLETMPKGTFYGKW